MFTFRMLLSCIFITNSGMEEQKMITTNNNNNININNNLILMENNSKNFDQYVVTCYFCVNVSDNVVCNKFAIDRACKPGETFCHTLHIMDSKGASILVNKKCTTDKECQRNKVGCVKIDAQMICVSCCDQNYCNADVPINSTTAIYDDRITKMRMLAKSLFREQEKALTTSIKNNNEKIHPHHLLLLLVVE